MALIEGLDYCLEGVDYEDKEDKILYDTFKTDVRYFNDKKYTALWDFLDYHFDKAARNPILLDVESVFIVAEDFCIYYNIPQTHIPELYKYMFQARPGFMTQAKIPYYMADKWNNLFPVEIKTKALEKPYAILEDFMEFMKNTIENVQGTNVTNNFSKHMYMYVINKLDLYMKNINDDDDDDDDDDT